MLLCLCLPPLPTYTKRSVCDVYAPVYNLFTYLLAYKRIQICIQPQGDMKFNILRTTSINNYIQPLSFPQVTTMSGTFPPEIWATILGFAIQYDVKTLASTSAVSSALRHISLPILHRTLAARIYVPDLHQEDSQRSRKSRQNMITARRLIQHCGGEKVVAGQVRNLVLDVDFDWKYSGLGIHCTFLPLSQSVLFELMPYWLTQIPNGASPVHLLLGMPWIIARSKPSIQSTPSSPPLVCFATCNMHTYNMLSLPSHDCTTCSRHSAIARYHHFL